MAYHAKLSPSSADRWVSCTASVSAQEGLSDDGSEAARQGTACHQMAAEVLEHGVDPQSYLGRKMLFWVHPESDSNGEDWEDAFSESGDPHVEFVNEVVITQEMIEAVVSGTNFVQQLLDTSGGTLEVEQRVPVGHFTGEVKRWLDAVTGAEVVVAKDDSIYHDVENQAWIVRSTGQVVVPDWATGSSDVVILTADRILISDFKFGRHKVHAYEVVTPAGIDIITGEARPEVLRANLQMACYALGSLEKFGLLYDFKHVTMVIVQPFMNHVSEYTCTVEELLEVQEFLRAKAEETRTTPKFVPSYDACHFCKKSGNCKAQTEAVLSTALIGFENVDEAQPRPIVENQLGSLYEKVDMITDWCKSVETRVFEELVAGRPVMRNDGLHYKLVTGKKGNRQWRDAAVAEATMKKMRLKATQMYKQSLISPADAEKLAAVKKPKKGQVATPPTLGSIQYNRLVELMHQKDGSPTVALETDPRPAIASAVDDFEDVVPTVAESCDDLF